MKNELRAIRTKTDISIENLAKKSGVSSSEISRIENNITSPHLETMCKLARALGVDVWDIFGC